MHTYIYISFGPDELADVIRPFGDALPGCCTGSFAVALAPAGGCTSYGCTHCLYVCMYVCMYVYIYIRTYVCTHCLYVCMYVCMYEIILSNQIHHAHADEDTQ